MDDKLPTRRSDVAIIGAGFSGINIACQLQRKLGVTDYVIYDRASDFGGTWFANTCETRHRLCELICLVFGFLDSC